MKISSLIDIIEGELINSPSVSFLYNIKINAKKVNEGDLFIAKNAKDLLLAINNGAFAIVYDFNTAVLDNEIAWIKVASYKEALIKIFRYKLSTIDLKAFFCDRISYEFLNINKSKNFKFISNNLEHSIKIIENIKNSDTLFCSNEELLHKIYPKYKVFSQNDYGLDNLIVHSLFECSFSYKNNYFNKFKLASLYLKTFLNVYTFCKNDFDLSKLQSFNSLRAIFLDKQYNACEHGKSDKFMLVQNSHALIKEEIDYINKIYSYGKIIYISSHFINGFPKELYVISNLKNLKTFLKTKDFNCVYLIGYDFVKVQRTLTKVEKELSLF